MFMVILVYSPMGTKALYYIQKKANLPKDRDAKRWACPGNRMAATPPDFFLDVWDNSKKERKEVYA